MKITQCDKFKNHYYDAEKYSSCPHCAKAGAAEPEEKKKGMFEKLRSGSNEQPKSAIYGDEKTVMLTNILEEDELGDDEVMEQVQSVAVSGSVQDIKTVAMYGFDDVEPVVGWLVAVSGEDKGRSFELTSGKNTIGRSSGDKVPDVCLDGDNTISRGTQATLIYEPKKKQFLLQNADGSTLVYLNGELLMTYSELSPYDKLTLGNTDLLFAPFCGDKFSW